MNVTVYGDSILKGVVLENGKYVVNRSWEQGLSERFGIKIRNRSRFGCTISKAMAAIRRDCETPCEEDEYAVLEFGGNDCDYDWAAIAAEPDRKYDCKTPPEQFLACYREAIALLRAGGRRPVVLTLPPIHSERYLRFICRGGLSRRDIVHWLGDVEAISRWQAMYSAMAEEIAREERTKLIDLRTDFPRDAAALERFLCADGIHPSRAGQGLIYQTLCNSVG